LYGLKLSLGLLFKICNILGLGWVPLKLIYQKRKRNVDKTIQKYGSTKTNRKRKKNQEPKILKILVS